jgi:hypothetical protein
MKVTVVPIIDPAGNPGASLATVMKKRLERLANELQTVELKAMETMEPLYGDVVIYISYNSKYNIRWRIVNDVQHDAEAEVAKHCDQLGYLRWKTYTINSFTSRKQ